MADIPQFVQLYNSLYGIDNKLRCRDDLEFYFRLFKNYDIKRHSINHKIKKYTYRILKIVKILINSKIVNYLSTLTTPVGQVIIKLGVDGITEIINKYLSNEKHDFDELTEYEKSLLQPLIKKIRKIYKNAVYVVKHKFNKHYKS